MYEGLENMHTDRQVTYSVPCDEHLHEDLLLYAPRLEKVKVTVINMHDAKPGSIAELFICRCKKPSTWMISSG